MESNINLYKFIFSKHFSANKQHKYTHNGYMKQILLYNTKRYNTYIKAHTVLLLFKETVRKRRNNNFCNNNNNNTACNSKFELMFLYPVKT